MADLLTKRELARRYRVSVVTIDDWLRRGCPGRRSGRTFGFDLAAVAEWRAQDLANQQQRTTPKRSDHIGDEARRLCGLPLGDEGLEAEAEASA